MRCLKEINGTILLSLLCFFGFCAAGADASNPEATGTNKIFWMVPHTHWEGAVFKTREEYLEMGLPHILTAVRLLKEHPEYRFALDQMAYFRPFLERYPDEAENFRKFVTEGRLQIVGGMNVMPDDNMPSGESFVRQLLYAKGYVRDALGVDVKTGWLVDTFGHHAQLPQILRLAGINSFWFSRGVEDRAKMPSEFMWQGIDGTRIPAFWLPHSYGLLMFPPRNFAQFNNYVRRQYDALTPFARGSGERVGLSGADVTDPELYAPELVKRFNEQTNKPFELRFGVPADFELAMAGRTNLPVITGERNPLFQGVYSTRIELKQRMRKAERLLTTAEKFGALANWLGAKDDSDLLWRAWDPPLFNVTHDLASGVMTDDVYADTLRGYDFADRLGGQLLEQHIGSVLARIDTRGAGQPIVVFNTLGWKRTDVAEATADFAESGVVDLELRDDAGKTVPAQIIEANRYADGKLRQVRFAFVARNVPSLGYAVYHVLPRMAGTESAAMLVEGGSAGEMENGFLHAKFDLTTGALTSLISRTQDEKDNEVTEWEVMSGPGNVVAVEPDHGDVWELNHNLDGGQNVVMTRPLPAPQRGQAHFSDEDGGKPGVARRGPVFTEIEVAHPFGTNGFKTRARIYSGINRVDFETKILNNDWFVRYRLLMPTVIKDGHNVQEIPFGACDRPMEQEFPAQNWMDASDARRGVALLNRAMPGNNDAKGTLMLSLARSTRIQSYGIGGGFEGQGSDTALELGRELTLDYALVPHAGDWNDARVYRAGWEFNQPLVVRMAAAHRGKLPARWGFADVSAPGVVVSALKPSKDGVVIRVYEADGRAVTNAVLQLHAKVLAANEANLMEDAGMKLKVRKDAIEFDLHPFEIKTFKLRLEQMKADK